MVVFNSSKTDITDQIMHTIYNYAVFIFKIPDYTQVNNIELKFNTTTGLDQLYYLIQQNTAQLILNDDGTNLSNDNFLYGTITNNDSINILENNQALKGLSLIHI